MRRVLKRELTTTQIIATGFLVGIIIGTLLLLLPFSVKEGVEISFSDALFTATSALCVTGLVTVETAATWSVFGKIVILLLIQFGGLGVITFTTTLLLLLHKRITLKERMLIQDAYNLDTLRGLVKLTIKILKGTLIVEGIGAIIYAIRFVPDYGLIKGIGSAVFNSVSAFCNAGMDTLGPDSLVPYRGSTIINFTTMSLIILGGLGFPVWWDLMRSAKKRWIDKISFKKVIKQWELHTKLVISITLILIFGGMFLILLFEWNNPKTLKELPVWEKFLASLFQSVTTRTAGFLTIPQENFTDSSNFLFLFLMFIGGSPSGTAGGVKTVTIGMMIIAVVSIIRGKKDVEVFHRKIEDSYVKKGMAIVMLTLVILSSVIMLLSIIEDRRFLDIAYEATSAIATVGLSRNFTSSLSETGQYIIIIAMYIGRIGPITLALFFNSKKVKSNKSYPAEKIRVG